MEHIYENIETGAIAIIPGDYIAVDAENNILEDIEEEFFLPGLILPQVTSEHVAWKLVEPIDLAS